MGVSLYTPVKNEWAKTLLFQIIAIGCIEIEVLNTKSQYDREYSAFLEKSGGDELNATWNLVNIYRTNFSGKYGKTNAIIPSRILNHNCFLVLSPILQIYFQNFNGINKLTLIQQRGNCEEFSQSIALLLNISSNHETRTINIQGADHAFPEVKINHTWWIVDKIYITLDKPIESQNFSNYIPPELKYNVANLDSSLNEWDLLEQHGYCPVNLSVTVIQNKIANHLDDRIQENAIVELYLISDSTFDPLISLKNTDEFGKCYFRLISGKKYLIKAKKDNMVGLSIVDLSMLSNQSNIVYLRKYG
jgi:hypothetical protein